MEGGDAQITCAEALEKHSGAHVEDLEEGNGNEEREKRDQQGRQDERGDDLVVPQPHQTVVEAFFCVFFFCCLFLI